jgi:heat shock protein HslJ
VSGDLSGQTPVAKKTTFPSKLYLVTRKALFMGMNFRIFTLLFAVFASCNTGSKATMEKVIAGQRSIKPADSLIQKQRNGIDIYATGNNPVSWWLEIDFDRAIDFRSVDGNKLNLQPSFNKKDITPEKEIYNIRTDMGELQVILYATTCDNDQPNGQVNKKVEVLFNDKKYTGCGNYLFNHQLHDVWILETIDNMQQLASTFEKGLPRLEFNLLTNKMSGTDGCNNISSGIEIKGSYIKFSSFTTTKMACSNNKVGQIFSTLLSDKLVNYYMSNGKLVLYLYDDSKIIFKRKEF